MTTERDDSAPSALPFAHRRGFLEALGAAVGVSALAGCTAVDASEPAAMAVEALVGTTPVKWVDAASVDLRTATASPAVLGSEVVVARGDKTANDGGGGGVFSWDSSSSSGDDGGTILVPPITGPQAGRWVRIWSGAIDIRWFGAVAGSPSAAAANNTALQNAIAVAARAGTGVNAGRVLVPQGQWYISATIELTMIDSVILTRRAAPAPGAPPAPTAINLRSWCGAVAPGRWSASARRFAAASRGCCSMAAARRRSGFASTAQAIRRRAVWSTTWL